MNTSNFHVSLLCSPKIHPICPLVFHIPLLIGVTFPSFHFLISSSVHYRDGCHFQVSSNMEIILKLHKQIYIYCLYTFIYIFSLPIYHHNLFCFPRKNIPKKLLIHSSRNLMRLCFIDSDLRCLSSNGLQELKRETH